MCVASTDEGELSLSLFIDGSMGHRFATARLNYIRDMSWRARYTAASWTPGSSLTLPFETCISLALGETSESLL